MRNEIELEVELPWRTDSEIKKMLNVIDQDQLIKGYTLDDSLNVVQVWCSIENDGRYNYHNNYDSSEPEMYVYMCDVDLEEKDRKRYRHERWWTLSLEKIRMIQKENIQQHMKVLQSELGKLENLTDFPKTMKETLTIK